MTECYRCGQEGHSRRDCPGDATVPPAAQPTAAAARLDAILHAPPANPQLARQWAAFIRGTLGWPMPDNLTSSERDVSPALTSKTIEPPERLNDET